MSSVTRAIKRSLESQHSARMEKEENIIQIQKEIWQSALEAYEELQRTKDYDSFHEKLQAIYRSYGLFTDDEHQTAMLGVLATTPSTDAEKEILGGNYGFTVIASKEPDTKRVVDMAKKLKDEYDKTVAATYLKGCNKCSVWAAAQEEKAAGKFAIIDTIVPVI